MAHVDWQVLLITGPTGAGKTTTARALAALQASPTIHICLDSVRESVRSGFADPLRGWTAEAARQYELALQACASVARLYVSNGFRCVIDDVFVPELSASSLASADIPAEFREKALEELQRLDPPTFSRWRAALEGLDCQLAVLLPSLPKVLERNAARSTSKDVPREMLAMIYEMTLSWRQDDVFVLDNSDLSPEEGAQRIEEHLS